MNLRYVKQVAAVALTLFAFGTTNATTLDPTSDAIMALPKIELGQAVKLFMLDKVASAQSPASVMWDYQANNDSVVWQDDAFTINPDATFIYREGLMRITVDSLSPAILTNRVKEMAWTVSLWTYQPPKFGVEGITFTPGHNDGKHNCFGPTAYHCTFNPLHSFQQAGIRAVKICSSKENGLDTSIGFKLIAENKTPILAALITSDGSGGVSTWLTLYFNRHENNLCDMGM